MMGNCRVCGSAISSFMSFGKMPIANAFLRAEDFGREHFFELAPAFCQSCEAFQIVEQPAPDMMFHSDYAFFSGTSRNMTEHFKRYAAEVKDRYLNGPDPFVVEIGSNDGILIGNFAAAGIRHLGVEPSANVAAVAKQKGVNTIVRFFDAACARKIVEQHGKADAIVAANVICHIPNIDAVAAGVKLLLKPAGVFLFEEPYLGDMVRKTSYDQIYDEHVFIFSVGSVSRAFSKHGLEVFSAEPQSTHGGSMRYTLAPTGSRPTDPSVARQLAIEAGLGLGRAETYEKFRVNCEKSREGLTTLLRRLRRESKKVVGYGATSKSTTVLNYCGIGPDDIEFISDTTPIKQGKFTPGSHIPVRSPEAFYRKFPDYAVLFAWNHAAEIREKETAFLAAGGRWIVYVPEVGIIA